MTAAYRAPARIRYGTTDQEAARDALEATYFPRGGLRMSSGDGFAFGSDTVTAGDLSAGRLWTSTPILGEIDRVDLFLGVVVLGGGLELCTAQEEVRLGRGDCVRYPTEEPLQVGWAGGQAAVFSFPLQPLQAAAELRLGPGRTPLRFAGTTPVSPRLARYWSSLLSFVERQLRADDSVLGHPLITEQTTRMLAEAALAVFPNPSMSAHHLPGPGHAEPAVVRRATAFIDAHAHEPLTVQQVAAAAGVGVRGLQHAFQRHLGTSPLGYARRVRLEAVHRELQEADPASGTRVSEVATRWGFANAGRFAGLYAETFGVLPSQTLRG